MKTVFFDVDTQIDFMFPAGALYAPGAERLLPAIAKLNCYAASQGIPVLSTTDAHTEGDPEFRVWPPHCVAGTASQMKPCATLLEKRAVVPVGGSGFKLEAAQQIILEKRHIDIFDSSLPAVLEQLRADRYVVYGLVTEYCVRSAALGLLRLGKPVEVVTDAIKGLNTGDSERVLAEIAAAGGKLTTVASTLP